MKTQSINIFNKYLGENETLLIELKNAANKKIFVDLYVKEANKFLAKKGLQAISSKEVELSLSKRTNVTYEEINDLQLSASSAHTQSSCTTSTEAGCTC